MAKTVTTKPTKTTKTIKITKAPKTTKVTKAVKVEKIKKVKKSTVKKVVVPSGLVGQKELVGFSKQQIIERFAMKNGDTGSPEVQIALSTQKIYNLTSHLEQNPKDNHSRRGLLKIIAKRRRILHYLMDKDDTRYKDLIKSLGLKK